MDQVDTLYLLHSVMLSKITIYGLNLLGETVAKGKELYDIGFSAEVQ